MLTQCKVAETALDNISDTKAQNLKHLNLRDFLATFAIEEGLLGLGRFESVPNLEDLDGS